MLTPLSAAPVNGDSRQFCSVQAKSLGADPIGTAPMYDEFLMVEFDLPWTRNVVDSRGFPEAVTAAIQEAKDAGRRIVVLAFAPDPRRSVADCRRIMYFSRAEKHVESEQQTDDDGAQCVADFRAAEYTVPLDDVPALTRFLLFAEGNEDEWTSHRVERDVGKGVRDLFVCTHGARDACCGKYGAALQLELDALVSTEEANDPAPIRVWRVSHLGGHRFAPTLLDLPSGRYWGALDSAALPALVEGPETARFTTLRRCYRGWTGLESAAQQVAEAEAWQRIGTDWLRYEKWFWTVASATDPELTTVAIEWKDPSTTAEGRIEVDIAVGRVITLQESCGKDFIESKQWTITRYDEA